MTRRISSLYTLVMKLVPVPVIVGAVVLVLIGIIGGGIPLFPDGSLVLLVLLPVLGFFFWHSWRLKFVGVDNENLYVSSCFKRTEIPLSEVDYISSSDVVGLVNVRLKSPSCFGSMISFRPTMGNTILSALGSPSVVDELRDLVTKASAHSVGAI